MMTATEAAALNGFRFSAVSQKHALM